MEKAVDLVDTMMKAQKEFLDSWVNSQRQFLENWTEATKVMQGSLLSLEGPQENAAKEMLNLYKSALSTMVDSSKVLAEEAGKLQATWKNTVEKQMDISRDMVKNFSGYFQKAA